MTEQRRALAAQAISAALGETGAGPSAPWPEPCPYGAGGHDTCAAVWALEAAGLLEQRVFAVERETIDGLYLFASEADRDAYAAHYPGANTGTGYVLTREQAARRIAEHCAEHGDDREECGCAGDEEGSDGQA